MWFTIYSIRSVPTHAVSDVMCRVSFCLFLLMLVRATSYVLLNPEYVTFSLYSAK